MPRQQIDCPICGTPMQKRVIQDGLEIDYCDWHGVWLDGGELEQLVNAFGARAAPPNRGGPPGVGKAIVQGLAGAAVVGAGFHLGGRLVGGILDALFNRRG